MTALNQPVPRTAASAQPSVTKPELADKQIGCSSPGAEGLASLPLTWHLTEGPLKRKFIFQIPSHRCYVCWRKVTFVGLLENNFASNRFKGLRSYQRPAMNIMRNRQSFADPRPSPRKGQCFRAKEVCMGKVNLRKFSKAKSNPIFNHPARGFAQM